MMQENDPCAGAVGLEDDVLRQAVEAIRLGKPARDVDFDRLYPEPLRRISSRFWTPIEVASRAVKLLVENDRTRVLDVGAGVGKLCMIGALTTPATFTGIEQRESLVRVGRRAVEALQLPRVRLIHGTLDSMSFRDFDALYFFNPFEENLFAEKERIDADGTLSEDRFWTDVALSEKALVEARVGTRLVTYHGFGGRVPTTYRLVSAEPCGTSFLRLWVKEAEGGIPDDGYLEILMS